MIIVAFVTLFMTTHIARVATTSAKQKHSAVMTPYVAPIDDEGQDPSGCVIIDNSDTGSSVPFVEVYGGKAYHYSNPKDYHSNDFKRRQEALINETDNQTDAYEIMRGFYR
ncbi:hypothetical protein BgAZ_102920 [Babesia gibsoni]|uniref:Uncharacterized protein n=1 Tax=Babesia gibsoni TaxID=33632 RepID=A0AAD8USX7_BABGI|nr:hypothetical protein BgAZ_102920 [Babesia gibsoni]